MEYNLNSLNALAVVSFLLGMANYEENLSQSDKDEMMTKMDKAIHEVLNRLEDDLEYQNQILISQNQMLEEILTKLNRIKFREISEYLLWKKKFKNINPQ